MRHYLSLGEFKINLQTQINKVTEINTILVLYFFRSKKTSNWFLQKPSFACMSRLNAIDDVVTDLT